MNRISFIALLFTLPFISVAQKKTFTFDQIFKGQFPSVFNPLPEIGGWVDDEHYIQVKTDDKGKETAVSVDVATGKSTPFDHPETATMNAPEISDAQNVT